MDPLANFFSQIKNAQMVNKETLKVPYAKLKLAIAEVLVRTGYLESVERQGREVSRRMLVVKLKKDEDHPAIFGIRKVSKLGQRVYLPHKKIWPVRSGYGLAIISTPKGLMTDKEARKQGVGGEVICEVWS